MRIIGRTCLSLIVLLFIAPPDFAAPSRPNIVFVLADQWRAQATGYAGDPNVKTPNLDALEKQSVDFTNAVSACPVCSPCRASLITGQHATTHGIFLNDAPLSDDAVTLPKVLRDAGYDTALIGKWHLSGAGRLTFIPPEKREGFEYWRAMECEHDYNHSFYFADDPDKRLMWDGYDAFAQTKDAQQYIRDHSKSDAASSKPFFLCLWWGPPHNPYNTAPAKFKAMYDPAKVQLRENIPAPYQDAARKDLAGYYAHCSALDSSIGELLKTLHDTSIERDTIVIFSADHGDMLWSHGFNRKQKPWDESIRVPMLWRYPSGLGDAGKHLDTVISSEDVMPTLLGLCGVRIPSSVEGFDYSHHMQGGENPNHDNAAMIECVIPFGEWNRAVGGKEFRGVRTGRYTYVRDLKSPWLLYDNQTDPFQNKNLANDPSAAPIQATLDQLLHQKLQAAHDEFLPAEDYLKKWGYASQVNANDTLPTKP
jgi:arylsulfatase A-like enzyme